MKAITTYLSLLILLLTTLTALSQPQSFSIESPDINGNIMNKEWVGAKVFTKFYQFIPKG
ncbi:MAG: hypothetical protein IPG99_22550 [Ignavibacteria bacterium]|nr:hypothetical protein [Ignavibacteria bacterium]